MSPFRIQILQFAALLFLIGPAVSTAQISENLLDPSLDQPLAQYRSKAKAGVEKLMNSQAAQTPMAGPAQIQKSPATQQQSMQQANPRTMGGSGGVELAPNPLANPQNRIPRTPSRNVQTPTTTQRNVRPPATAPRNVGGNPASPWNNTTAQPQQRVPATTTPRQLPTRSAPPRRINTAPTKPTSPAAKSKPKKKKQHVHNPPELHYNVYRETSVYPLDPRKSNNPCTAGPDCGCSRCGVKKMGLHGRPFQPQEPGGYRCGKKCPNKRPEFSVYWPKPLSAKRGHDYTTTCGCCECGTRKKVNDLFDGLSNFRLINYNRTDNGYCGPESDPYGCLGESKVAGNAAAFIADGNVSGVGYRAPGEPVAPTVAYPLSY